MRIFGLKIASVAAVAVGAVGFGVSAGATTNVTSHSQAISQTIPVTCGGHGLTSFWGTGNSVQHITINNAGDAWLTTTMEGTAQLTTSAMGTTIYSGHVQFWFGLENNQNNGVQHATFSFNGVNVAKVSDTLQMHASFTVVANANGVTTVNNVTATCN